MKPVRKIPEALTGVHLRTSTLPDAGVSGLENHRVGLEPFAPVEDSPRYVNTPEVDDHATRKCVYNYEDKYTFARILVSDSLVFDSHFESGNLHSAFRVVSPAGGSGASAAGSLSNNTESAKKSPFSSLRPQSYDLYMSNDCYTQGHTQWFYFSVKNVVVGQSVNFNIRNFSKPDSLFTEGMRPLLLSTRSKRGWIRAGKNIRYYYSNMNNNNTNSTYNTNFQAPSSGGTGLHSSSSQPSSSRKDSKDSHKESHTTHSAHNTSNVSENSTSSRHPPPGKPGSFVLSFQHTFEFSDDVCYFAYCLPYTYTDLLRYLAAIDANKVRSQYVRRTELCRTLAGNSCALLTITAPARTPKELSSRVGVVFTARVHPGESNASWILQGILDFLTGDSAAAAALREQYVFKIIPMLNPDGVINGNYRCSLAGVDLNRRWSNPDPQKHPTVYHTKRLLGRFKKMRHVGLIVDIHGHSLKQGAFFYGCSPDKKHMRLRPSSPPLVPHTASNRARSSRERARDGLCLVSPEGGVGTPVRFSPTLSSEDTTHNTNNTHNTHPLALSHALSLPFDNLENHYFPLHYKSLPIIPDFASKKDDENKWNKNIDTRYQDNYGECSTKSVDVITEDESEKSRDFEKYSEKDYEKIKYSEKVKEKKERGKDREKDRISLGTNECSTFEDRTADLGHVTVPVPAPSPLSPQGMGTGTGLTPHGVQLPHKRSSLRDVLSWRVHLYPRICSALAPLFTVESCSYKLQRAKASTFRMVAFTELGVDCAYTLEASLAGLAPYHFGAQELLKIGEDLCRGLLVVHPTVSVNPGVTFTASPEKMKIAAPSPVHISTSTSSPVSYDRCSSDGSILNRLKDLLVLDDNGRSSSSCCASNNSTGVFRDYSLMVRGTAASRQSIPPLLSEMQSWRPLYIYDKSLLHSGTAVKILSEYGLSEITISSSTPADAEELSDEDDDPEKSMMVTVTGFGRTVKVESTVKEKRKHRSNTVTNVGSSGIGSGSCNGSGSGKPPLQSRSSSSAPSERTCVPLVVSTGSAGSELGPYITESRQMQTAEGDCMTLFDRVAMMKRQREREIKEGERDRDRERQREREIKEGERDRDRDRDRERRGSPFPPAMAIQSAQKRTGVRQTSAHYPSTSLPVSRPAACSSAKESKRECDADTERERGRVERGKGRPRVSGSHQHSPVTDRNKVDESHMISLSPTVQQLLNPVGQGDSAPFSVPPKREFHNTFSPISRRSHPISRDWGQSLPNAHTLSDRRGDRNLDLNSNSNSSFKVSPIVPLAPISQLLRNIVSFNKDKRVT